jgi:hypothetical protein
VRLTPKSIFIGLIVLGLPFAVALGWTLGSPDARFEQPPAAGVPGGAGTIGAAPGRGQSGAPIDQVRYAERRPAAQTSTMPSAPSSPPPATTSPSADPLTTLTTLPPLLVPPVPTPTTATSEPASPSAGPSDTESSEPKGDLGAGGLLRRR